MIRVSPEIFLLLFSIRSATVIYFFSFSAVNLYVVAYKRERGKMSTIKKGANEDPWYYQIVRNFALPKDVDLGAQPTTSAGLAPVAVRKPKAEPRDTADIPASNPDDPIDLESSPEPLRGTKAVKRKPESEAVAQPTKKIIRKNISKRVTRMLLLRSSLQVKKPMPYVRVESSSAFKDDLLPSPPRTSIKEQLEGTKAAKAEVEKAVEVEEPVTVESEAEKAVEAETADVGVAKPKSPEVVAHEPEKEKSIQEDPMVSIPSFATTSAPPRDDVEKSPVGVCRDWLQGVFPPAEVKFQVEQSHDQTYHAYLEETTSSTLTTHHIVREWRSIHKNWATFKVSKKEVSEEKAKVTLLRAKLEADQAKFESEQKTEEWSATGWKRKAESEAALLSEKRKHWREICDKDNSEKMALRNSINNLKAEIEKLKKEKAKAEAARDEARSHRERSKQREVERVEKAETSRRLAETAEKLENSETARVTMESLVDPLKNDMLWKRHHGIINGYTECTQHVNDALKVDWDNSRSATRGVGTGVAHATAKSEYNNLRLPVMDLVTAALQSDDFVAQLRTFFLTRQMMMKT
ncbi:hypothetical protein Hdeb2414_s0079g00779251 [Helianthus debilis subsp. tardiflorus]